MMTDSNKSILDLDELNQQFSQQFGIDELNKQFEETLKKKTKKKPKHFLPLAAAAVIVLLVFAAIRWGVRKEIVEEFSGINKEQEYKEQFEKVNLREKYLGLNEKILISGKTAHIGLVNSIGSDCAIRIKIYDKKSNKVYYQSQQIMPGSVLHTAILDQEIKNTGNAQLEYSIYNFQGEELGKYQTGVVFEKSEAGKGDKK